MNNFTLCKQVHIKKYKKNVYDILQIDLFWRHAPSARDTRSDTPTHNLTRRSKIMFIFIKLCTP